MGEHGPTLDSAEVDAIWNDVFDGDETVRTERMTRAHTELGTLFGTQEFEYGSYTGTISTVIEACPYIRGLIESGTDLSAIADEIVTHAVIIDIPSPAPSPVGDEPFPESPPLEDTRMTDHEAIIATPSVERATLPEPTSDPVPEVTSEQLTHHKPEVLDGAAPQLAPSQASVTIEVLTVPVQEQPLPQEQSQPHVGISPAIPPAPQEPHPIIKEVSPQSIVTTPPIERQQPLQSAVSKPGSSTDSVPDSMPDTDHMPTRIKIQEEAPSTREATDVHEPETAPDPLPSFNQETTQRDAAEGPVIVEPMPEASVGLEIEAGVNTETENEPESPMILSTDNNTPPAVSQEPPVAATEIFEDQPVADDEELIEIPPAIESIDSFTSSADFAQSDEADDVAEFTNFSYNETNETGKIETTNDKPLPSMDSLPEVAPPPLAIETVEPATDAPELPRERLSDLVVDDHEPVTALPVEEVVEIAEEFFAQSPDESLQLSPNEQETMAAVLCQLSAEIDTLKQATTAEECNEQLTEIKLLLAGILHSLGYHSPEYMAAQLLKQYAIDELHELLRQLQYRLSARATTPRPSFDSHAHHLFGRHILRLFSSPHIEAFAA